jgi:hypothetical protein
LFADEAVSGRYNLPVARPADGPLLMRQTLLVSCLLSMLTLASPADDPNPPAWTELVGAKADGDVWKSKLKGWIVIDSVVFDEKNNRRLATTKTLLNGKTGRVPDLVTKETFGDHEIEMEFLIAKRSNSGVKFHGLYEIQITDSHGKKDAALTGDDCGGVYPRATLTPVYKHLDKGIPPKKNAARPAGEWQKLTAIFVAARFDKEGKKTTNAKLVKATLNGVVIHENVELKTPTGHNHTKAEMAKGPLMLQGDHGPVAFRNVRVREYRGK